jgi:hypothetical protein
MRELNHHAKGAVSSKWRLQDPGEDWAFDVSSIRADHDAPLEVCVAACRRALNRLNYVVMAGDLRDSEARIDARSEQFALVRITLEVLKRTGRTRTTFSSSRFGDDVSRILRDEFELCLADSGPTSP